MNTKERRNMLSVSQHHLDQLESELIDLCRADREAVRDLLHWASGNPHAPLIKKFLVYGIGSVANKAMAHQLERADG